MGACGIDDAEIIDGARHSGMDELADATAEVDKVLIF
jgi:sulfur relay (sulfurtransferase) complex TusBCD TusD component (DsrE family)